MVLVLSGQPFLRVPEAARIYHEGLVREILLLNEPKQPGQEDLRRLGIRYPDSLEVSLDLFQALRVPREAILTIPERADNTQTEALIVSRFLATRSVRTLIIVTSKAHSTRARKEFEATLGPQVGLVMRPVPADPFDPHSWWEDATDSSQTVLEYAALMGWWLRGLWHTVMGQPKEAPPLITVR